MPVGSVSGGDLGLVSPITGRRFLAARIVVRDGDAIFTHALVSSNELDNALKALPDGIRTQLEQQRDALASPSQGLELPGRELPLSFTRPRIMGVLNVTPDSFSDGGKFLDADAAIRRARQMIAEGADIIDIGGESTRPGAKPVWEGEEAGRVLPVIEALQAESIPLSIDTRHSFVMDKAVKAGAHIINDVSALTYDGESMTVAAFCNAPVVLMHAQGTPQTMQDRPSYAHVLYDVYDYLAQRIAACEAAGISRARLILDPGIGFGKRVVQDNLALINGLPLFLTLGCPVLLGVSRKRFIGAITGEELAEKRMVGSVAAAVRCVEQGAQIVRVHDVAETIQALRLTQAFHDAAIMDGLV
ncbi:dihydropteroate synthase [Kordiimonas aestuarii]|uniref:dihydropteroate synthase n=1 Tax=Kordiimonas aestuarii TaxID=1005925 RepID=UPI0021CFC5DD|nr:dihydropteroate synthase [Kordiimonas aestuarii]